MGTNPNGTWKLFAFDRASGDRGTIAGFTLLITPQLFNTTAMAIPDALATPIVVPSSIQSSIQVAGLSAPIGKVRVAVGIAHTYDADLDLHLIAPDGTAVELSTDNGSSGDNYGSTCDLQQQTTFDDAAPLSITAVVAPFIGVFKPEGALSSFNGKNGNGTWKLQVSDDAPGDTGTLMCWSLIVTEDESAMTEAPGAVHVTSVVGNTVTMRWDPPVAGRPATGYVLEGGVAPGETLVSLPTGSAAPTVTLAAPSGAFTARIRTQSAGGLSEPSNEVPLFVNVPLAPSAPARFAATAVDSTVDLSWAHTFAGGAPTSMILDATGPVSGSIPLPLGESVRFTGVPPGIYQLQVRAANAAGASAASELQEIEIPGDKCDEPDTPTNLLAYHVGQTINLAWDPGGSAGASTSYILNVTGAYNGTLPWTGRSLSAPVPSGTYSVSLAATNACGTSGFTAVQTITIP